MLLTVLVAVGPGASVSAGFVPGNAGASSGVNRYAELVAIDGTRAIISAEDTSGNGQIRILDFEDNDWVFVQTLSTRSLNISNLAPINGLAIDDDLIAATTDDGMYVWQFNVASSQYLGVFQDETNAYGAVAMDAVNWVAVEPGTTNISRWTGTGVQLSDLTASSTVDTDTRLAISDDNGRTLAVGNPNATGNLGRVDVFQNLAGGALPTSPSFTYDNPIGAGHPFFGSDVAVDTDGSIAVGHRLAGASDSGAAWVYRRTGSTLTRLPIVEPAAARSEGEFGRAVDLVDGVLVVGEPSVAGLDEGRISEFQYDAGSDRFVGGDTFTSFTSANEDWFGIDLAVGDDGIAMVASPLATGSGGTFSTVLVGQPEAADKVLSSNPGPGNTTGFGTSVSISGTFAAVGEPGAVGSGEEGRVEILEQAGDGSWSSIQTIQPPGFLSVTGFGTEVALDGNLLVVLSYTGSVAEITFFERPDAASNFALAETFSTAAFGRFFSDIAIDGDAAVAVSRGNNPAWDLGMLVFQRVAPTDWAIDENITLPSTSIRLPTVAISGDVIAVGVSGDPNGASAPVIGNQFGAVFTYTRVGGIWGTVPASTLRNPAADTTGDLDFGFDVALEGTTLLVGHRGERTGGALDGAAWIYEESGGLGLYGTPARLTPSTVGDGELFGSSVALDGSVAVIGSLRTSTTDPDRAHVFTESGGVWTENKVIEHPDFGSADGEFGAALAVESGSILIGAPGDANANGFDAGAVYWDAPAPVTPTDDAILTIDVTGPGATVTAGASGIPVRNLPARAIEGYGGSSSNVAATSLDTIDGADGDGEAEVLVETNVADLGLAGATGVGRELLESILLSDIVIEGGWETVLTGSAFEGLPLQNVTFAEVLDAGLIDGQPLDTLDVSATPIGSIPIGSIALASINLDDIPLPGGQDWCDLLASIGGGYDCTSTPAADPTTDSLIDLTIQGTPIGSIPIGSIPIGSIPIGSIPIGSIPIGSIDIAKAPIGSIPIGSIDIGATPIGSIPIGSIPIGSIPIGSIDIAGTPIGSIPIDATTIGAIELGELTVAPGIAASPIGSIPIGSIDLAAAPIGSIPIGSIPIGSIPIGSIPIGSIDIAGAPIGSITIDSLDLAASPIGSIPIGSIPIGSIPIGSIALSSLPIGSIPIGSIPITGTPIGSIELASIDLDSSPIGSIPIGSIPAGDLATVIDCDAIDCEAGFLLADAADAGALQSGATLDVFQGVATGVRLVDLIGLGGLDRAAIEALVPGAATIAGLLTVDDLTLADLPAGAAELALTDLADLAAALDTVSLQDLLAALGESELDLRAELTAGGIVELNDLDANGMVLGDLPTDRSEFQSQTIAGLLAHMSGLRLGDLLALHPTLGESDIDWGTATLDDVSAWENVTLAELEAFGATTVAELVLALVSGDEATFGDLLLSLVGTKRHDWSEIKLGAIELENTSGAQTFTSGFEVTGGLGSDRTVTIRSTIPDDGAYVAGSTVIRAGDGGSLPDGSGEPAIDGNQLVWTLSSVRSNVRYEIDIDVVSALSLGTNTVTTTGAIVGLGVEAAGFANVGVQQAFEPNDEPGDAGIVDAVSGTIYASHIADTTDVDLFEIDLTAGSRLSVALSDLPADYDLVVYGPPVVALAPPLRQIDPAEPPEITVDPTANDSGGTLLQDVPLLDLPVVGVSTNRSTESESVVIDAVRGDGTYFVQVTGYRGASSSSPYALYIASDAPPTPLTCVAQDYQLLSERGTLPTTGELNGANTFVLVNRERLFGKYGVDANVALDAIDALVNYTNVLNTTLGTTAVVVEVDGDTDVRAAYDALDAASCDPAAANAVVGEINTLVDSLDAVDPTTPLEQILIVGDDDIVPMARIADDTNIANERTYASTFLDSSANSLFGALSTGHFLSDDPYGDADPIQSGDRILYVTDIGLGRLVETPAEIAGQVATFIGFEGQLDPSTALVTGYDFLTDGTNAVTDALSALPDVDTVTEINNETWTADDVITELFPDGTESPNLASINAHYDHYRALPADQNAAGTESDLFTTADVDLAARQGRLAGRSLFSMGCHGGLSVPDELFPGTVDGIALDWAQAYARQGAIWVGNTGFGYGETEGVELSERLMALYAGRLDGSVNAGEALLFAKQEYVGTQQATYGAFDEKVLQQTVFYGIPFYEVAVAVEPTPAPIPPRPATSPVPGSDLRLGTLDATPGFTPNTNDGGVVYRADLPAGAVGVVDEQGAPFGPILPTISFDVSDVDPTGATPQTIAQGAVITGLTTTDVTGVDPDLARPIVDDSEVETEPRIGDVSTDPAIFVSSFSTPEGPRQSLTAVLGTFRSTEPDGSGTQRLFDQLEIETYYRTPGDDSDQTRPVFREVTSLTTEVNGEQVLVINATVEDDLPDNVLRVFALVAVDPGTGTVWKSVELGKLSGDRWSGSLVVGAGDIEFLVQAVDTNGNTALSTNKTEGFDGVSEQSAIGGPIEVAYSAPAGGIFTGPVTLTATASGAIVDVQIDGGPITPGSSSTEVTIDPAVLGEGTHTVVFTTESGERRTEVLVFDSTAPVATIISPVNGATVDGAAPGRVRFSCTDTASGIASCTATLDSAPITSNTALGTTPGTYDLEVTATDAAGISTTSTAQFTVSDVIDPVVTVPADISAPTDPGLPTAVVTFTATATDEGAGGQTTPAVTCIPASGSAFLFGTTEVTCTATDAAGNIGSAAFDVTVTDSQTPTLTVPSDIAVPTDPGEATAVVTFANPVVTDNLPTNVSCDSTSGQVYPVGTTTVSCTVTDAAGNTASGTFSITVIDEESPVIAAASDVATTAPTSAGVAVSYTSPAVTDNVDGASTATCLPLSGEIFSVGDTTVTCNASDSEGNAATSVSFTVSVTLAADTTAPVVTVPADISVSTDSGSATAVVSLAGVSAVDDGPSGFGVPIAVACDAPFGNAFPVGVTTVTCSATDAAGNTGSDSFTVTVTDDEAPVFGAAPDVTVDGPLGSGRTVTFSLPTATDNVDGSLTVDCLPASGSAFSIGVTEVTCSATDTATNTNSVSFDLEVILLPDTSDPVVSVPADVSVPTDPGSATAVVSLAGVSAVDDSSAGFGLPIAVACDAPVGGVFPVGETLVTCSATDLAGNTGSASFTVTVTDDEAPVVSAAADVSAEAPSITERSVTFDTPSATDNVDGAVGVTCAPASGSTFELGDTTVTCSVDDAAGNTGSTSFTVTLTLAADDVDPVLNVPANISISADAGTNSATVTFAASATDDGPGGMVSLTPTCTPASGSTFTFGVTTVTCDVADGAGNTASESFTVTVTDDEAPVITPVLDFLVVAPSVAERTVDFDLPTATDNVDASVSVSCAPASGTTFELGDTTVSCTATDASGNAATITFEVTLTLAADVVDPVVVVPADITVSTDTGAATAVVDFAASVSATDGGPSGTFELTPECTPASGSAFSVGDTPVTCTATDTSNNTDSASFTITVTDGEAPVFNGASDQSFEVPTVSGGPISFVEPTAVDNVDGAVSVTCTPASGDNFSLGTTEVTCTATDAASNAAEVSFNVQVAVEPDTVLPVVIVPADIVTTTDAGLATAIVTFDVTATDDGPAGTVAVTPTCEPASGSVFPIGVATVTCSATDASANTGSASFTVTVTDDEAPVFGAAPGQAVVLPTTAATPFAFTVPAATDNSGAVPTVVCDPLPGADFELGTTTVTCDATDEAGNTSTIAFDVTATLTPDITSPTVNVPTSAVTAVTEPGANTAIVTFAVSASDNGPSGTVALDPTCVPASGSAFLIGNTTVTCTATDTAGNETSESFTVAVTGTAAPDTTPPTIELPFSVSVEVDTEPGQSFAIVEFEVTATDTGSPAAAGAFGLGDGSAAASAAAIQVDVTCSPASGSRFSIGTTTVNCSATDAAGNTGTASFDVIVNDAESPTISQPAGGQVTVRAAGSGPLDYPLPTVLDNSGDLIIVTCDPPPGSVFPLGTTRVTCQATDGAGNTSTIAFDIVVERQRISGDLPATGGGGIDLRPAWATLVAGLLALFIARRRSRPLRVTHD